MVAVSAGPTAAGSPEGSATAPPLIRVDAPQLLDAVRDSGGRAVLVNVWATWCLPCREEFPDLLRLRREHHDRGFRLLLVSADFPEDTDETLAFLAEHDVRFPTYLKVGDDMEFIDGLEPRWTGALPATLLYDGDGRLRFFREGAVSYEDLGPRISRLLERPSAATAEEEEP